MVPCHEERKDGNIN